jgi:hypothetical protein
VIVLLIAIDTRIIRPPSLPSFALEVPYMRTNQIPYLESWGTGKHCSRLSLNVTTGFTVLPDPNDRASLKMHASWAVMG